MHGTEQNRGECLGACTTDSSTEKVMAGARRYVIRRFAQDTYLLDERIELHLRESLRIFESCGLLAIGASCVILCRIHIACCGFRLLLLSLLFSTIGFDAAFEPADIELRTRFFWFDDPCLTCLQFETQAVHLDTLSAVEDIIT